MVVRDTTRVRPRRSPTSDDAAVARAPYQSGLPPSEGQGDQLSWWLRGTTPTAHAERSRLKRSMRVSGSPTARTGYDVVTYSTGRSMLTAIVTARIAVERRPLACRPHTA